MYKCKFCNRLSPNPGAAAKHIKHCKLNPMYVKAYRAPTAGAKKGSIPWNKGKKGFVSWNKGKKGLSSGRASTPEKELERRRKISEKNKLASGGHRPRSGRGKKGRYEGFWCDSSWELAFVIYNLEHNIVFARNEKWFPYTYDGVERKFYPDFLIDGAFYEIKGYCDNKTKAKIEQFPHELIVLDKHGIQTYISYAESKYGKDYTRLYSQN